MRKLRIDELNRIDLDTYRQSPKSPVVVVLDNVRSLYNVGSVFRTCDAFAVEALYLCGITAKPPHRDIQKTALGATESVSWKYFDSSIDALQSLKDRDYRIVAVEQTDSAVQLGEWYAAASDKLALVFGHEVSGVSDEALAMADASVEIPQFGTKHSLNISVSVGILLWQHGVAIGKV